MCCCVIVVSTGCSPSNLQDKEQSSLEGRGDFSWPAGKRAAISLTFDDARFSQIDNGLPLLDEYGAKATFYVSLRPLEERQDAWKKAAANGHEIGNHTMTHPCSGNFPFARERALENYTLDKMRYELQESNNIIERLLGVRPVSFAYPCGQKFVGRGRNLKSYVPLIAEEFLAGRGWMDEWSNEQVKQLFDRTLVNGGWLVFCGHEIGEGGRQTTRSSTLKAICEYAQDPANGLWLDTVEEVAGYILKQRTGTGD
jgi:peptidoglycan/xylan/chitin deacetylase (PgdA/CDA1 family)